MTHSLTRERAAIVVFDIRVAILRRAVPPIDVVSIAVVVVVDVVARNLARVLPRIYVNVARIQEGYYRLAGFDELALRIRSPEAPRRSKAEDGKEPAAAGETPEAAEAETAETLTSPTQ